MFNNDLEQPVSTHFTVKEPTRKVVLRVIGMFIPILFAIAFNLSFELKFGIKDDAEWISIFLGGGVSIYFFMYFIIVSGKRIIVDGINITIVKNFFFKRTITLTEITKCEWSRGYIRRINRFSNVTYDKVIIYYKDEKGRDKKVAVGELDYEHWDWLLDYMKCNNKAEEVRANALISNLLGK